MTARKKPAEGVQLVYVGGVDDVHVRLASGRYVRVVRGEAVDLTAAEAKPLHSHPDWAPMPDDITKES